MYMHCMDLQKCHQTSQSVYITEAHQVKQIEKVLFDYVYNMYQAVSEWIVKLQC